MEIIRIYLSDMHLNQVEHVQSAHEMWKTILDIFERHKLLNKLTARRKFYTATMLDTEKILTFTNRVRHLAATLESIGVNLEEYEMAMDVLNGLPERFDSLICALDAICTEERGLTLDFVKSRLLQEE